MVAILLGTEGGKKAVMSKQSLDIGPVDVLVLTDPPTHTRQRKVRALNTRSSSIRALKQSIEFNEVVSLGF